MAQGFNKYYPPDWKPEHGSLNAYHGVHALRDRARKLDQGIMIIRFEMPFNIWCLGCQQHVAMGVRFNAEKSTVGKYLSTPIYQFRFKCHLCPNYMVIRTDPKNSTYECYLGCKRKEETFDAADAEVLVLSDAQERDKRASNAFAQLEHSNLDLQKAEIAAPQLETIKQLQDARWQDPFTLNAQLRSQHRQLRKTTRLQREKDAELQKKFGFNVPLLSLTPSGEQQVQQLVKMQKCSTVKQGKRVLKETIKKAAVLQQQREEATSSEAKRTRKSLVANYVSSDEEERK